MKNNIVVSITDYNRLVGLIEVASLKAKMPVMINHFYEKLKGASMHPQESIGEEIITMNSRVQLRELSSGRETEVTVTYPQDAEPGKGKVSVFSPIGMVLLGRKESDVVSWKIPSGVGTFEIVKVNYQPEAAGDYYL